MMKINPELVKKIENVLVNFPKADENTIVDKLSATNELRMKK